MMRSKWKRTKQTKLTLELMMILDEEEEDTLLKAFIIMLMLFDWRIKMIL